MIILTKIFVPKGFKGITLFPFIFLRESKDKSNLILINHEKIHLRQQIELLILPFYIWYIIEFIFGWIKFKNKRLAYRNISFEKEAYFNESNLDYLKKRTFWKFINYI